MYQVCEKINNFLIENQGFWWVELGFQFDCFKKRFSSSSNLLDHKILRIIMKFCIQRISGSLISQLLGLMRASEVSNKLSPESTNNIRILDWTWTYNLIRKDLESLINRFWENQVKEIVIESSPKYFHSWIERGKIPTDFLVDSTDSLVSVRRKNWVSEGEETIGKR